MNFDALKDFELYSAVSNETIEKYQGLLPPELLEIWKDYGYGTFFNGYLKVINPDEYREIFDNSYYASGKSIPIFTTGFGDIITFKSGKYVGIVLYRKSDAHVFPVNFPRFLQYLDSKSILDMLDKKNMNLRLNHWEPLNMMNVLVIPHCWL